MGDEGQPDPVLQAGDAAHAGAQDGERGEGEPLLYVQEADRGEDGSGDYGGGHPGLPPHGQGGQEVVHCQDPQPQDRHRLGDPGGRHGRPGELQRQWDLHQLPAHGQEKRPPLEREEGEDKQPGQEVQGGPERQDLGDPGEGSRRQLQEAGLAGGGQPDQAPGDLPHHGAPRAQGAAAEEGALNYLESQ